MCGIVGAAAQRNVVPILLEGLRRLEYRGYDSAGLATLDRGLHWVRSVGRVNDLAALAQQQDIQGRFGIAHTRWATHGAPSERNAHPHLSCGQIAVVHNGIIENHEALRQELVGLGYEIASDTDTEVIAHLVHYYFQQSGTLLAATQSAIARLHGAYAIAVLAVEQPDRLVAARKGSPLLLGVGIEEHFVASDVSALLPVTNQVVYLEEGDVVELQAKGYQIYDAAGARVTRPVHTSELSADMAELGHFRHFMQKEIHEQPRALGDTLENVLGLDHLNPGLFGAEAEDVLGKINSVHLLACGTSFHAARVAQYWLEGLAGIPTTAEVASEYRYRGSVANPDALVVVISQSGETADTIAALQHAQALGHRHSLAICNVAESALVRAATLRFLTHAGPEIGVASTKAFTTQLAALFLLTVSLGKLRGRIDAATEKQYLQALRELPGKVQQVLALEPAIANWAEQFTNKQHALFLGRGVHYPIAMEGALKLKEISYIHAEAYPAGELKHGPLALVDQDMPVIAIAPNDALLEKLKSNLMEVRARGGELYVFADEDTQIQEAEGVHILKLPVRPGPLSPILHTVPLQLLSYHAALNKGTDVDKPRNLAKSVTVE